jgi:hypothetical protein
MSESNDKTNTNVRRFTRRVEEVFCPQSEIEKKEKEIKTKWEEDGQKNVDVLCKEIEESDGCILMNNNCYYWKGLDALFPDLSFTVPIISLNYEYDPSDFSSFMPGSRPLLDSEASFLVTANCEYGRKTHKAFPFLQRKNADGIACFSAKQQQKLCNEIRSNKNVSGYPCKNAYRLEDPQEVYTLGGENKYDYLIMYLPIYRLSNRCDIPSEISCGSVIRSWIANNLSPKDTKSKKALDFLRDIPYEWKITKDCKLVVTVKFKNDHENLSEFFNSYVDGYKENLLICDQKRANLTPYDAKVLTDIGQGHWELWEKPMEPGIPIKLEEKDYLVARDPREDIRRDVVAAIDFGTKSTVVVLLEKGTSIQPMRIGLGDQLSQKAEDKHYENPTVMEFIDFNSFLSAYHGREGRPFTAWNDLVISHQAFDNLTKGSKSDEYHAFISELKQWAGDRKKYLILQDIRNRNKIQEIPPYCDLQPSELDPIEIYAYMLGLNINNMIQGLHLEYILSFPVTYEKNIRNRLLKSFENGLRKSLPQSILNDAEVMEGFSVVAGTSEPAAYAICALKEYGFNKGLQPGDKIAFGVFDFGGGTTDFDFGIWRRAEDTKSERRFDNVIEHYGAGGDPRLGGENILERLAYETFVRNEDLMRSLNASFICPSNCVPPPGFEKLINNRSQEAHLNTHLLIEKLRDFWEHRKEPKDIFGGNNEITLSIYNNKGEPQEGQKLTVAPEMLIRTETDLISNGIDQFFHKMSQVFGKNRQLKNGLYQDCIRIFLAGNSCKSEILKTLFKQKIEEENQLMIEKYKEEHRECEIPEDVRFFDLYPPLGSEEAKTIQEERHCISEYAVPPTGKTGVAYGLIHCRPGSRIKVIDNSLDKETEEIGFRYFLGYESNGILKPLLFPDSKYGEWVGLFEAEDKTFEIYYTSLAAAANNELKTSTEGVIRKRINIKPDSNACIFLRPVSPTQIEYAIAVEDNDEKPGEFKQEPQKIDLEEK